MILIIHGEENLLSQRKLEQLKNKFLKNNESTDIESFDETSFNVNELEKKISVVPFFSTKRMIIIKNILNEKLPKKDLVKTEGIIKKLPSSTILIFINTGEVKKSIELYKIVKKHSHKEWLFKKMTQNKISQWASNELSKRGGKINSKALQKLLLDTDNNVWQIDQEIDKLIAFKNNKEITENDIERLVNSNSSINIFDFINSIGQKNKKNTISNLEKLLAGGEEPISLFGMIIYQLRSLIIIKEMNSSGLNYSQIAKKIRKHPFAVQKTLSQINNFSEKELEKIYQKLLKTELELKRGGKRPSLALETLSINLCS